MKRFRRLAVVIAGLACSFSAQADFVSFEIYGGNFDCFGGESVCEELSEVTGLDGFELPFSVNFTIDTDAEELEPPIIPPNWNSDGEGPAEAGYLIRGPNTMLEITHGDLVLGFPEFSVAMTTFDIWPDEGGSDALEIWGFADGTEFFFQFLETESSLFVDYTLEELAEIPLDGFSGGSFNISAVSALLRPVQDAFLLGGGPMLIRRVPEPGTLALLGIGLFGMGLARRKKA